jgi:hypothetical protein
LSLKGCEPSVLAVAGFRPVTSQSCNETLKRSAFAVAGFRL